MSPRLTCPAIWRVVLKCPGRGFTAFWMTLPVSYWPFWFWRWGAADFLFTWFSESHIAVISLSLVKLYGRFFNLEARRSRSQRFTKTSLKPQIRSWKFETGFGMKLIFRRKWFCCEEFGTAEKWKPQSASKAELGHNAVRTVTIFYALKIAQGLLLFICSLFALMFTAGLSKWLQLDIKMVCNTGQQPSCIFYVQH